MKTVSKIIIYPIKSLNGISVPSAKLTSNGFYNDRKFMLIDVKGNNMITLREFPTLYQLKLSFIDQEVIKLENEKNNQIPLIINLINTFTNSEIKKVKVWDDLIDVQPWNEEADDWFSEALGIECQLVKMAPDFFRQVDKRFASIGQGVLFSDGFPFLICTEESLEMLNKELEKKVSIYHFRPNIVIKGGLANEEFNWKYLTINEHKFNSFKPCARCQVISIDPDSQLINEEILPLMSKKYLKDKKIIFGLNACWEKTTGINNLKVGDSVISFNKADLQ